MFCFSIVVTLGELVLWKTEDCLNCSRSLSPIFRMSRNPYPCAQNIKQLHLLISSEKLRISQKTLSKILHQWRYVLLHVGITLVIDIWVVEFKLIFLWLFGWLFLFFFLFRDFRKGLFIVLYFIKLILFLPPILFFI